MGVPALFRWLSKKYPKIVESVIESQPTSLPSDPSDPSSSPIITPIDYSAPNPNGFEIDNLYLDMNGIVHPCTHPENGSDAPLTEEDMMVEIFKYTERVVNMARPRKVLMMAIDGVAPRAKMNQQRSRRFRAAQEAAEKAEERREAVRLFEAMGHPVSEAVQAEADKVAWDSNAITPGTPFMDLLAASLRYWVSHKLNTDPGWKDLTIIISDASVPGEGEHKIMDWIRRQRSHPEHDPNTSHVIYGLDADLIMLALATHEPYFKVLREDVFAQQSRDSGCHRCGKTGHIAANCTGEKKVKVEDPNKPVEVKPFIFLDVSCLREYLAVELDLRYPGVPFDLERAIDDWVFLIFFVGNDFLPHLPSLEIREGAIDTLLGIWKREFGRMGGYVTNYGKVELGRAQIILDGLAQAEDDIFRRRKQAEERQNPAMKRQNWTNNSEKEKGPVNGAMTLNNVDYVAVNPASGPSIHPSLPTKPGFAPNVPSAIDAAVEAAPAEKVAESNVAANKSAAARLRKMLRESASPVSPSFATSSEVKMEEAPQETATPIEEEVPAEGLASAPDVDDKAIVADEQAQEVSIKNEAEEVEEAADDAEEDYEEPEVQAEEDAPKPRGRKRKAKNQQPVAVPILPDVEDEDDDEEEAPPCPDADQPLPKKAKLKVGPNGVVESEDTVLLWEPGYRERYYRQKFGVELDDVEFREKLVLAYLEGLSWVLHYYYQGAPSWQWYYPYHYAPFAADFQDIEKYKIEFKLGKPFKPFEQLMGVFPAASKVHLPEPFQVLMTDEDSPILDFYPPDFEIDMNGKKMAWQGIALLPFIEQDRLLAALKEKETELTVDEKRRNTWGDNVAYIADDARLHSQFAELYTKQKMSKAFHINTKLSRGVVGMVAADPNFIPGSTMTSPLSQIEACPDIYDNRALAVKYYFPKLLKAHRSVLLPGVKTPPQILGEQDRDFVRNGRRGRGGGPGGPGRGGYGGRGGANNGYNTPPNNGYAAQSYSAAPLSYVPSPAARQSRFDAMGSGGPASAGGYGGNGSYGASYVPPRPSAPVGYGQAAYGPVVPAPAMHAYGPAYPGSGAYAPTAYSNYGYGAPPMPPAGRGGAMMGGRGGYGGQAPPQRYPQYPPSRY